MFDERALEIFDQIITFVQIVVASLKMAQKVGNCPIFVAKIANRALQADHLIRKRTRRFRFFAAETVTAPGCARSGNAAVDRSEPESRRIDSSHLYVKDFVFFVKHSNFYRH